MGNGSLLATILSAFLVTFATVVIPSPSTVAASRLAFTHGWRAAASFLAGVVTLDIAVFCGLALGFQPFLQRVGGAAYLVPTVAAGMIIFGFAMMIRPPRLAPRDSCNDPPVSDRSQEPLRGAFLGGLLVPAANPGFWMWWMTVGTSFIHAARHWGDLGLASLLAALVGGVAAWYLPLVLALRRGSALFPPRSLRRVLRLLGAALVAFGAHLLIHSLGLMP
jgi:threonine/homoserine/homoserine lactone efflux protein